MRLEKIHVACLNCPRGEQYTFYSVIRKKRPLRRCILINCVLTDYYTHEYEERYPTEN